MKQPDAVATMRTIVGAALTPLFMLTLAGCVATAPSISATNDGSPANSSAASDPSPSATPQGALDSDVTLVITTTATATNGATLALEMRVHKSVRFDDIAGQTIPAAIAEDCPTTYSQPLFAAQKWSFARANISALPGAGADWPSNVAIATLPSTEFLPIAARGFLTSGSGESPAIPTCQAEKHFVGAGNGAFAFGIPGDSLDDNAAGSFTRWANHRFGFRVPTGVTLTGCTITVTALGRQYGAEGASWSTVSDASTCSAGAQNETREY
jgi:hypothetical protein